MIRLVLATLVLGGCQYAFPLEESRGDAGIDGSPTPGGRLDETFAGRGWRTITLPRTSGRAVAVAANGSATAVGFEDDQGIEKCVVLQLDPDGNPAAFGMNGEVVIPYGVSCVASGVALYEDKVILAGTAIEVDVFAARLLADGSRDPSFASDGTVALNLGEMEYADDVAAGPDGILLVGGEGTRSVTAGSSVVDR